MTVGYDGYTEKVVSELAPAFGDNMRPRVRDAREIDAGETQ